MLRKLIRKLKNWSERDNRPSIHIPIEPGIKVIIYKNGGGRDSKTVLEVNENITSKLTIGVGGGGGGGRVQHREWCNQKYGVCNCVLSFECGGGGLSGKAESEVSYGNIGQTISSKP